MANKRGRPDDCDEVNASADVSQMLSNLYMNSDHADVTFVIENEKIPAHKVIVSSRSPYFDSMLNGCFVESSQSEIELKVPLDAFKEILRYIYTGRLLFVGFDVSQIVDVSVLADLYGFEELKCVAVKYLITNVSLTTCCEMFEGAREYAITELQEVCFEFMERNARSILMDESFRTLSITSLSNLLERKTFYAPEIEIFNGVKAWVAHNRGADVKEAIKQIRWSLISEEDLTTIVFPSEIFDQTDLVKVIAEQKQANVKGDRFNQYGERPLRMETDRDDDLEDLSDHRSYLVEAKKFKHLADKEDSGLAQTILYLKATLQFLFAGLAMERERHKIAAFTMYKDSLSLVRYIKNKLNNHQQRSQHNGGRSLSILNVLCLRYQSLINYKLYKLRSDEAKERYEDITGFFSTTGFTISPTFKPSKPDVTLAVPRNVITTMQHEIVCSNYLISCHEYWDEAYFAVVSGELQGWFKQLDDEIGSMSLNNPFRKSVEYVRTALRKLNQI